MKKNRKVKLLTRKQAAEMLSISLTTLKVWTTNGSLPGYQLGGKVYYKEEEILSAMNPI